MKKNTKENNHFGINTFPTYEIFSSEEIEKIRKKSKNLTINPKFIWSDMDFKLIEKLKIEFQIRKKYELKEILIKIDNLYNGIKSVISNNLTDEQKISYFQKGVFHIQELGAFLTPGKMGSSIYKDFKKVLDNKSIKKINDSLNLLETACIQCMINLKHERKLKQNKFPKMIDSEKTKSLKKTILTFLLNTFKEISPLKPSAYTHSHSPNGYNGNLYRFCIKLRPILKRKFDLDLGSNQTIGKYLKEIKKELQPKNIR